MGNRICNRKQSNSTLQQDAGANYAEVIKKKNNSLWQIYKIKKDHL